MIQTVNNFGYKYVNLSKNKQWKHKKIHQLVANAFLSKPDGQSEVNHIDGNPSNNHVSNLEFCTHVENMKHAYRGRLCGHPEQTNFTVDQVIEIYKLTHTPGITLTDVANKFDANYSTIRNIKNRYAWKNVTEKIMI